MIFVSGDGGGAKMVYDCKILTVEDHLVIRGDLVVLPDFALPQNAEPIEFFSKARVVSGDSVSVLTMHVTTWRVNLSGIREDVIKHWRVQLCFPNAEEGAIPVGSEVYLSEEDCRRVRSGNA